MDIIFIIQIQVIIFNIQIVLDRNFLLSEYQCNRYSLEKVDKYKFNFCNSGLRDYYTGNFVSIAVTIHEVTEETLGLRINKCSKSIDSFLSFLIRGKRHCEEMKKRSPRLYACLL